MSENKQNAASPAKKDEKDAKNVDDKTKAKGKDAKKEEELVRIAYQKGLLTNFICRARKTSKSKKNQNFQQRD